MCRMSYTCAGSRKLRTLLHGGTEQRAGGPRRQWQCSGWSQRATRPPAPARAVAVGGALPRWSAAAGRGPRAAAGHVVGGAWWGEGWRHAATPFPSPLAGPRAARCARPTKRRGYLLAERARLVQRPPKTANRPRAAPPSPPEAVSLWSRGRAFRIGRPVGYPPRLWFRARYAHGLCPLFPPFPHRDPHCPGLRDRLLWLNMWLFNNSFVNSSQNSTPVVTFCLLTAVMDELPALSVLLLLILSVI